MTHLKIGFLSLNKNVFQIKNNSTGRDSDICVRNSGHNIPTLQEAVLTQHVTSCRDRIEVGEENVLHFKKEPGLIY